MFCFYFEKLYVKIFCYYEYNYKDELEVVNVFVYLCDFKEYKKVIEMLCL